MGDGQEREQDAQAGFARDEIGGGGFVGKRREGEVGVECGRGLGTSETRRGRRKGRERVKCGSARIGLRCFYDLGGRVQVQERPGGSRAKGKAGAKREKSGG